MNQITERRSIDFRYKFRDFRFSDEVLLRGTFKPTKNLTKVQFQHFIDILGYLLISPNERKIKFHFRLVMRPDIGEINFDIFNKYLGFLNIWRANFIINIERKRTSKGQKK